MGQLEVLGGSVKLSDDCLNLVLSIIIGIVDQLAGGYGLRVVYKNTEETCSVIVYSFSYSLKCW